jgi:hypothetical protein
MGHRRGCGLSRTEDACRDDGRSGHHKCDRPHSGERPWPHRGSVGLTYPGPAPTYGSLTINLSHCWTVPERVVMHDLEPLEVAG